MRRRPRRFSGAVGDIFSFAVCARRSTVLPPNARGGDALRYLICKARSLRSYEAGVSLILRTLTVRLAAVSLRSWSSFLCDGLVSDVSTGSRGLLLVRRPIFADWAKVAPEDRHLIMTRVMVGQGPLCSFPGYGEFGWNVPYRVGDR